MLKFLHEHSQIYRKIKTPCSRYKGWNDGLKEKNLSSVLRVEQALNKASLSYQSTIVAIVQTLPLPPWTRTFNWKASKGKVHRKKSKKKLTSVSFAFTHKYTLEKLKLLLFFPKRTWKILKNVQNAKEKTFHFITLSQEQLKFQYIFEERHRSMKENCLWGRSKTNNSAFSATHTYIKLTLLVFFYFFSCTYPLQHFAN